MPTLPADSPAGLQAPGFTLLVFRLEPAVRRTGLPDSGGRVSGRLETGFGRMMSSDQAGRESPCNPGSAFEVSVDFPQSGETRTFRVCPGNGHAVQTLMFFSLGVLAPFDFSGIVYDPLGSLADSVARLAAGGTGSADATPGRPDGFPAGASGRSSRPDDALMALWAAVEADLYRFAKDPGFTAAVDAAAREQPEEYRRFARLNELYRDLVKLLIPYGLAPRRWNAWLRGQEYRSILPGSLALYLEDFLCGCTSRPLAALSGILVRHGACIMMEQD